MNAIKNYVHTDPKIRLQAAIMLAEDNTYWLQLVTHALEDAHANMVEFGLHILWRMHETHKEQAYSFYDQVVELSQPGRLQSSNVRLFAIELVYLLSQNSKNKEQAFRSIARSTVDPSKEVRLRGFELLGLFNMNELLHSNIVLELFSKEIPSRNMKRKQPDPDEENKEQQHSEVIKMHWECMQDEEDQDHILSLRRGYKNENSYRGCLILGCEDDDISIRKACLITCIELIKRVDSSTIQSHDILAVFFDMLADANADVRSIAVHGLALFVSNVHISVRNTGSLDKTTTQNQIRRFQYISMCLNALESTRSMRQDICFLLGRIPIQDVYVIIEICQLLIKSNAETDDITDALVHILMSNRNMIHGSKEFQIFVRSIYEKLKDYDTLLPLPQAIILSLGTYNNQQIQNKINEHTAAQYPFLVNQQLLQEILNNKSIPNNNLNFTSSGVFAVATIQYHTAINHTVNFSG